MTAPQSVRHAIPYPTGKQQGTSASHPSTTKLAMAAIVLMSDWVCSDDDTGTVSTHFTSAAVASSFLRAACARTKQRLIKPFQIQHVYLIEYGSRTRMLACLTFASGNSPRMRMNRTKTLLGLLCNQPGAVSLLR